VLVGEGDRLSAILGADLGVEVGDVAFDRARAEEQGFRDLAIGPTAGEQPQHLDLARLSPTGAVSQATRSARLPARMNQSIVLVSSAG